MKAAEGATAVAVRDAEATDAARIAELSSQLGYASTPAQVERRLEGIRAVPEHAVLVAELGGDVVGALDVFVLRAMEADPRAEIVGLVVDERQRSRGVGRILLERAEEWARGRRCAAIGLRSNVLRERAHAFYERLGYRLEKTQKAFRKAL